MSLNGPIICVEDDEDDQFLIQHALQQLGVANPIRFFSNGQDALDHLLTMTQQPFLILCDINMPLLNGIELRQQITDNAYLREKAIPFVFLTTAANMQTVQQAYKQMVQGFYKKASSVEGIQQQLKHIVEYWQGCLHPNSVIE
ncbi:response regulator [Larkinella insperata]|uniref:Response regulator n=1 Tax=Larkinella insperata TaxID=332158 RepID=A0ABW3QKV3_9BACT